MAEFDGIPRVVAEISDGNLRTVPVPGTPKVTLLGITDNANALENEPVLIRPNTNISDFDLSDGTASEISRAIVEARDGGAENIEVVVIHVASSPSNARATTAANRATYLATTYALLINHPLDIVVVLGANIDTPSQTASTNFAYQLANFCFSATRHFNSCLGVIGTEPPLPYPSASISLAQLEAWVAALETYDTTTIEGDDIEIYDGTTDGGADGIPDNYAFWATTDASIPVGAPPSVDSQVIKDRNNNPVDIGKFVSVVAGSYRYANDIARKVSAADGGFPTSGWYHNSGAAAYAGMIAGLRPHHSPTNKTIGGVDIIRNLSIRQADRLAQKRFVVLQSQPKGIAVVNAMTGAYNISTTYRSDYVRLSTIRITLEAIERVRSVCDPFLGEPHNGVAESAMRAEIDQVLLKMQTEGALRRYEFNLVSTPAMQVLGQITIDLQLVPAFEITEITINVALRQE